MVDFIELPVLMDDGSIKPKSFQASHILEFVPCGEKFCTVWTMANFLTGDEGIEVACAYDVIKKALMVRSVG